MRGAFGGGGVAGGGGDANFGPDGGDAFAQGHHEDPEVDVGAFEAQLVGSWEDGGGDDVQHPEGLFFGEEEEEEAGEEVEGLAVADFGMVDCEGLEDAAEGGKQRSFVGGLLCRRSVGFEVDVVGKGAVEVSLDGFLVVWVKPGGFGSADERRVNGGVFLSQRRASCIVEPCGSAPGSRYAFANVSLRFG